MKRILILAVLVLFGLQLSAQVRAAKKKDLEAFTKTKTLVVLDENPFSIINEVMKDEMKRFWKATPYEFITMKEFDEKKKDEKYSFIVFAEIEQTNLDNQYNFLNFALGSKTDDFNEMPDLGSVPLSYTSADEDNYLYKVGAFLMFMQNYTKFRSNIAHMRLQRLLNVKDRNLHSKEIWFLEEELEESVNTIEKIKEVYPHGVRIATREEIRQAIHEQNPNVAFLHKIGPEETRKSGRVWKFIVSASDGLVLFSNNHDLSKEEPDAFLRNDFKEMAK